MVGGFFSSLGAKIPIVGVRATQRFCAQCCRERIRMRSCGTSSGGSGDWAIGTGQYGPAVGTGQWGLGSGDWAVGSSGCIGEPWRSRNFKLSISR